MEMTRRYVSVFIALLVLTTGTLVLSYFNFGVWSIVFAMLIAIAKSTLVILFFMHLIDQHASNWIAFVISVLLLVGLMSISIIDVLSREDTQMIQRVVPGFRH